MSGDVEHTVHCLPAFHNSFNCLCACLSRCFLFLSHVLQADSNLYRYLA